MNVNQEDRFSMYHVVGNTCERYQTTWNANAAFAASYALWAALLPLIIANRDAQILETTGITTDKTAKRAAMCDKALFMENRLRSYANVTNNPELAESVKYTASDLKKARDNDVIGICNIILAKANANAAALESYIVTADMITDFEAAITTYTATLVMPKVARSQTKTATENLIKLFKEADDLLSKRLDLDIEPFKTSKPEFYSQYKTARIVVSTKGGPVAVLGCVTIAGTGEPLKGVMITFVPENNGQIKSANPIVKISAEKGNFRASMPENIYRVTAEKIGYKKKEMVITVAKGETTVLNIELEKN